MQGCHDDSDKSNNAIVNLRWDTPKGNIEDRRCYNGSANPNAKLSDLQVEQIITRRACGDLLKDIGIDFGISCVRVSQIFLSRKAA